VAAMKDLYTYVVAARSADHRRHLIHSVGEDQAFPRSLCDEAIRLRDDSAAEPCKECRRRALSEIAIALSKTFGLDRLGVKVATEARTFSYGEEPLEQTA